MAYFPPEVFSSGRLFLCLQRHATGLFFSAYHDQLPFQNFPASAQPSASPPCSFMVSLRHYAHALRCLIPFPTPAHESSPPLDHIVIGICDPEFCLVIRVPRIACSIRNHHLVSIHYLDRGPFPFVARLFPVRGSSRFSPRACSYWRSSWSLTGLSFLSILTGPGPRRFSFLPPGPVTSPR